MKRLSEYFDKDIRLVQHSKYKRECELRAQEETLFKVYSPNWKKSNVVVEGFDARWIMRKPSIWKSDIEVCKEGFNYSTATFKGKAFNQGGVIHMPRGLRLPFEVKALKETYTLLSDSNEMLIQVKQTGLFKKKSQLIFGKRKTGIIDEYPWLPIMMWYIILHNHRESIAELINS